MVLLFLFSENGEMTVDSDPTTEVEEEEAEKRLIPSGANSIPLDNSSPQLEGSGCKNCRLNTCSCNMSNSSTFSASDQDSRARLIPNAKHAPLPPREGKHKRLQFYCFKLLQVVAIAFFMTEDVAG